jgi:chaperonin GroES
MINMTEIKVRPLADRVLVEPQEAEEKTAGGILIPDNVKERPQRGQVISTGPGTEETKMEVKVGDIVLYGKYSGTEIVVDRKVYLMMRQSDILAITS